MKGFTSSCHPELVSGSSKKGFTLIELLVVVLIIGILSAVALPQYTKAVTKTRFAEAMSNLKTIAEADQVCRLAKGGDTCKITELDIGIGRETLDENTVETKDFYYRSSANPGESGPVPPWVNSSAQAQYKKEDVCLCYLENGKMVVAAGVDTCAQAPSFDYAKLLNVAEPADTEACSCC